MDRGRGRARATKKRATLTSHSQDFQPETETPTFPTTPINPSTSSTTPRIPFTAPQRGGKSKIIFPGQQRLSSPSGDSAFRVTPRTDRPARSTTFPSNFTFDSPSLSSAASTSMTAGNPPRTKRAKTFEASYDGAADDEAHSKGGHSLRRRARIDYTQEQIDDPIPTASRQDPAAKSATTPNARSRKRKDSEDDFFDDAAAHAKRRRSENPAAAHGKTSSVKRRPELEPGQTTLPFKVIEEQQSDNEIRDTILVGISMEENPDENADETEESDLSSTLTRPSSSDGSESAAAKVQPATPQPQVVPHVEEAVALAPENEVIEKELIVDQPGEAEMPTKDVPIPPLPIQLKPDNHPNDVLSESEVKRVVMSPEPIVNNQTTEAHHTEEPRDQSPEHTVPVPTTESTTEAAPHREPSLPPSEKDLTPPSAPIQTTESTETPKSPEPPVLNEQAAPAPKSPEPPSVETAPEVPQKGRLETIYSQPTPYGSQLRLTPYENEEVLLPGPYLEKHKPVESSIPTPTPTPSPVDRKASEIVWDPRRPLKQSEFFKLYRQEMKKRAEMGLERMSMIEFNNYCARKHKVANDPAGGSVESPLLTSKKQSRPAITSETVPLRSLHTPLAVSTSFEDTPQGSQAADSPQPTAPPSPTVIDEAPASGDNEQETKELVEESAEPPSAAEPVEKVHIPRKQYSFPKIRDPSEFIDALENWQDMDTETLYKTTAAATEALHIWEQEAAELRKIIDDEDNAKRRLPNDKAIENWENRKRPDEPEHWRRHFDESHKGPPPFELKGVRAPKPYVDDPVLERQKENDRIMAQAYGFKYDPHPARVGKQNPEEQRWDSGERGLRDRKKTEKGAELAEENVIEGKRTRKPRNLSDQSKEPSRAATPIGSGALGVGRRAKRKAGAGAIPEDENKTSKPVVDDNVLAPVAKKRRGPRPRAEVLAEQEEAAAADKKKAEEEESQVKPAAARKRAPPPTSVPMEYDESKSSAPIKNKQTAEIASSSFYSNPSPVNTPLESRPSTASSEATVHTTEAGESAYSLRDKRKRNFVLENDPELEPRAQKKARAATTNPPQENAEPKKRAPRKKNTAAPVEPPVPVSQPPPAPVQPQQQQPQQPVGGLKAPAMFFNNPPPVLAPAPGPFIHTFNAAPVPVYQPHTLPPPIPEPPAAKKPIVRIKISNNGTASQGPSRTPTPANIAPNPATKSTSKAPRAPKPSTPAELAPQPLSIATSLLNGDQGEPPEKPYAEMSKSEKMSYSMRRRWASGEMKGAVEKRRTTLANKKAEKAAGSSTPNSADPSLAGRTPDPSSAGPSAPTTPALLPTQGGPLAFPPPSQGFQTLQSLQQPMQQGLHALPPQGLQPIPHGLQPLQHSMPPMPQNGMPQGLQPPQQPHPQHMQQPMQPLQALQQPPHLLHQPPLTYSYHPPQGPIA